MNAFGSDLQAKALKKPKDVWNVNWEKFLCIERARVCDKPPPKISATPGTSYDEDDDDDEL